MIYTIEEIRSIVAPIAEKYQLKAVYLFGSYARGTATDSSDIDLIVDTTGTDLDTLFKLGSVYNDFADAFCEPVDLITVSSLEQPTVRPSEIGFRKNVMEERMNIYAAA